MVLPLAVTLHRVIKAARITLRNFSDSWIPTLASKIDDLSSTKKSVETTCEFERQLTQRIFLSPALIYLFFGVPQNSFHAGLSRLFDLGAEVTEGHWPEQRSSTCTTELTHECIHWFTSPGWRSDQPRRHLEWAHGRPCLSACHQAQELPIRTDKSISKFFVCM